MLLGGSSFSPFLRAASREQTQGRETRVGNSTTSEHLPTRHSERPRMHVQEENCNVSIDSSIQN